MSYEYNLKRLFQPQVDQLPLSEQLPHYYERDLVSSHLYRLGTDLFKESGIKTRRRLIDASLYSPPSLLPHRALLKKYVDGTSPPPTTESCNAKCKPLHLPTLKKTLDFSDSSLECGADYYCHNWTEERQRIRNSLDGLSAYKCWLFTKERTPVENTWLFNLRHTRGGVGEEVHNTKELKVNLKNVEKQTEDEPMERKKSLLWQKKHVVKEVTLLERHLVTNRHRLVQMLTSADRLANKFISVSDMLSILSKLKIPVSQATTELLLDILEIDDNGLLNYSQLLNGMLLKKVEDHFQRHSFELIENNSSNAVDCDDKGSLKMPFEKYNVPSSMDGKNGALAGKFKKDELKQFNSLIAYCEENGIVLDWKLAEKALLLPPDHTKAECTQSLRQSGLGLLSCHFDDPCDSKRENTKRKILTYEGWGRPYKELRGKKPANYAKLFAGRLKVQPKVDCWLTFQEYLKLTEHIRSRPEFKYKEHGLPDNSAFWPQVMLGKLQLWLPVVNLQDKASSLHNIFQQVRHPKIYNPLSPLVEQKTSWPDNSNGYVQFGGQTRKQYHV